MEQIPKSPEHDHLRIMIEQMQRAGHPEHSIHEAVRQASSRSAPDRTRPSRRVSRFGLLGRLRRP
jgi:hypothetical protein